MRVGSPVMIAPHLANDEQLAPHASKVFRVMSFDGANLVALHSVGGDLFRPTMLLGMKRSELVVLHAKAN